MLLSDLFLDSMYELLDKNNLKLMLISGLIFFGVILASTIFLVDVKRLYELKTSKINNRSSLHVEEYISGYKYKKALIIKVIISIVLISSSIYLKNNYNNLLEISVFDENIQIQLENFEKRLNEEKSEVFKYCLEDVKDIATTRDEAKVKNVHKCLLDVEKLNK